MTEAIDARFLRSMLYEPLPGSASVILVQLGIIEESQVDALGARTYDAESARLSLALADGRTVELERAMHLHTENGYAVRIRSRAGQTISRSFIHIDRDLGVRNLYNDRMVYINDADLTSGTESYEPTEAEIEAIADAAHEAHTHLNGEAELIPGTSAANESHQSSASDDIPGVKAFATPVPEVVNFIPDFASPATGQAHIADEGPAAPQPASDSQSETGPEALSPESYLEMLEILPEPDLATVIYFQEAAAPDQAETQNASQNATQGASQHASQGATRDSGESSSNPSNPSAEAQIHLAPEGSHAVEPDLTQAYTEAASPEPITLTAAAASPTIVSEPAVPHTPLSIAEAYELHPDYAPLHAALTPAEAVDFSFIAQTGTIHTYEHRQTFRYIHIDAPSGLFYDQTRTPISRTAALKRALPPTAELTAELTAAATAEPAPPAPRIIPAPDPPTSTPEPNPAPQALASPKTSPAAPLIQPEPELRVRSTYSARAEVKPEPIPDSDTQLTPSDFSPSFDAFTRKHGSPLDRDSWRDRIADLSRTLRLNRNSSNSDGSNGNPDS